MTLFAMGPSSPAGTAHPAVVDRRIRGGVLTLLAALIPLALALAIAVAIPHPRFTVTLAVISGALAVIALMLNPRIEITVAMLALYLGLLDGPIRLTLGGARGGEGVSAIRDVLIFAIALGAILRLLVKRERVKLPPLSGWVLALVAL